MVDFAGWEMPLHYGSQLAEHEAVRTCAGCFDVSHMGVVDFHGDAAKDLFGFLVASDIERLEKVGQSFYTVMLNEQAGIIDDLIVYRTEEGFRAIVNASTKETDLKHIRQIQKNLGLEVEVKHREELNIVAVQGPKAVYKVTEILGAEEIQHLDRFNAMSNSGCFVARTGYTGEDGVEIVADDERTEMLWNRLLEKGVQPCGLAARDSLRLEAGLNLNTQDMTDTTLPDEANLKWTVHMDSARDFHGKSCLESSREEGVSFKLTGLVVEDKGIVRHDCVVHTSEGDGTITSGLFSPTLGYSIGLARVPTAAKGSCKVEVRKRELNARLVRPPFVRNGVKVHR